MIAEILKIISECEEIQNDTSESDFAKKSEILYAYKRIKEIVSASN